MKRKIRVISISMLMSLLLSVLSGCGGAVRTIEKPYFIKCKIPEVPKAELEPLNENATYPEKLRVILNNYLKLKRENKMLMEVIEACK